MSPSQPQSRREFLRGVVRHAALGGLLIGAGYLVAGRESEPAASDTECTRSPVCSGCGVFGSCLLPRALATRRAIGRES